MGNLLLRECRMARMTQNQGAYGLLEDGALAISGERIEWVGAASEIPESFQDWPTEDLSGRLLTPALIDCHTQMVFGGHRAREFELGLEGASYEQIAREGGGILSTVR